MKHSSESPSISTGKRGWGVCCFRRSKKKVCRNPYISEMGLRRTGKGEVGKKKKSKLLAKWRKDELEDGSLLS